MPPNTGTLKRLRIALGDSQEAFAARLGMTEEGYRRIEAGITTAPRPRTLRAIADVHGVSVDYLLAPAPPQVVGA